MSILFVDHPQGCDVVRSTPVCKHLTLGRIVRIPGGPNWYRYLPTTTEHSASELRTILAKLSVMSATDDEEDWT